MSLLLASIYSVCKLPTQNGVKTRVFAYTSETIYHNIPCPHRSGRVQRESGVSPVKPAVNSPLNRAFCA
ncbi:hypothetical protein PCN061_p210 (plasmid) [Escherichia coli PCN061]|nr:hypothetical protein PCN061_p210 [Escherichia coli PCN061]